ncbi:YbaB/EbfC family nucleoid-associated protein [Govanella unica]|uniref:Nucleoid-associated protein NYP16_03150 n=1 Tax=Govanella unica TaxID=2975056 RepID=A0A9X3TWD4_9PROT|nr:YbaB/EbfC family nucleoid-associated protein [Govania unica]MDA5192956.1 YbaB/EbfC family nucleoid-associated protein [Govania unica]
MKNIGQMMKQAQQMQERMQAMQEELAHFEITGSAGGGLVTVTLNGKGVLSALKIDPSLVTPDEVEVVEDLIKAAHADARTKVDAYTSEQMSKLTGGLQLPPGFKMPF